MSKKLLNEGTIRRFMKLADITPFTNTFLEGTAPPTSDKDESEPIETPEMTPPPTPDPPPMPSGMTPSTPANRDEEDADMDLGAEIPPELADTVANLVADALNDALPGVNLNVEAEEGEDELGDLPSDELLDLDAGDAPEAEDLDEDIEGVDYIDDDMLAESIYEKVIAKLTRKQK